MDISIKKTASFALLQKLSHVTEYSAKYVFKRCSLSVTVDHASRDMIGSFGKLSYSSLAQSAEHSVQRGPRTELLSLLFLEFEATGT